jgi:hypothetical protein
MNEDVKSLFVYRDGNLYRLKAAGGMKAGSLVGWESTHNGKCYKRMTLNSVSYYVHQVIFLYHYGFIPKYIDHKDGNSLNNKIENLREATQSQNVHNSQKRSSNTSGFKGVIWLKNRCKWRAQITVNGKNKNLGQFQDINDAAIAYEQATVKFFGEFAKSTNRMQDRAHQ